MVTLLQCMFSHPIIDSRNRKNNEVVKFLKHGWSYKLQAFRLAVSARTFFLALEYRSHVLLVLSSTFLVILEFVLTHSSNLDSICPAGAVWKYTSTFSSELFQFISLDWTVGSDESIDVVRALVSRLMSVHWPISTRSSKAGVNEHDRKFETIKLSVFALEPFRDMLSILCHGKKEERKRRKWRKQRGSILPRQRLASPLCQRPQYFSRTYTNSFFDKC